MFVDLTKRQAANLLDCLECTIRISYNPIVTTAAKELKVIFEEQIDFNDRVDAKWMDEYFEGIDINETIVIPRVPADFKLVEDCQVSSINAL